jgi:hypothetical protein
MDNADYAKLEARFGRERLSQRLLKQARKEAKLLHQGEGFFRIERFLPLDRMVDFCLRVSALGVLCHRNFLAVRVVEREWFLPRLPRAFDRFRLLQLSDLHLDLDPALTPVIQRLVLGTPHDAAVVTGDFRDQTDGDYGPCLREMEQITGLLAPQRWGILGNHDAIEMVPALEAGGLPVLLNEVASVRIGGDVLWIGGIDDPHFYKTHDLERVRGGIPCDACSILLSHSPETYDQTARLGFDLQLSGHTHGGQLCLPGGIPIVVPCKVEKKFILGRWVHGSLQGYTSPGTGSCGVAARLNCPPEITLHILRSAD